MPLDPARSRAPRRIRLGGLISGAALLAATAVAAPAAASTDDPLRGQQWGLDQIRSDAAWTVSTGEGAVVAVVDSGVDLDHPDLRGNLVPGATFTDCNPSCGDGGWEGTDGVGDDRDEHGTHVSGIIAAVANNGIGITGVAPDARVMPIKALEEGSGSFEDIANGIRYATDNGADVVNLSLGALPGVQALTLTGVEASVTEAIAYANEQGVLVVAAAGNEAFPVCDTPAFEKDALCVTSTTREELPSYFSNGGVEQDLYAVAAPGGEGHLFCENDIVSTVPLGTGSEACGEADYDYYAGTSMAAPHVAGVGALLFAQGRTLENVKAALTETARTPLLGTGAYTTTYGHGIVDAAAATAFAGAGEVNPEAGQGSKSRGGGNGGGNGGRNGKGPQG